MSCCRLLLRAFLVLVIAVARGNQEEHKNYWVEDGKSDKFPFKCESGEAHWHRPSGETEYLFRNRTVVHNEVYSLEGNELVVKNMKKESAGYIQCVRGQSVYIYWVKGFPSTHKNYWVKDGMSNSFAFECESGEARWYGSNGETEPLLKNGLAVHNEVYSLEVEGNKLVVHNMKKESEGYIQCTGGQTVYLLYVAGFPNICKKHRVGDGKSSRFSFKCESREARWYGFNGETEPLSKNRTVNEVYSLEGNELVVKNMKKESEGYIQCTGGEAICIYFETDANSVDWTYWGPILAGVLLGIILVALVVSVLIWKKCPHRSDRHSPEKASKV